MRSARTRSIWSLAAFFGPVVLLVGSRQPIRDNSYLWHVTAGRLQLREGSVLTTDPFSFTALGQPWRTQSWLPDLAYAWGVDGWGIESGRWIAPLVGALLFATIAAILGRFLKPGLGFAVVTGLSALTLTAFMNPRPVVFSYLAMALVVLATARPRLLWTVPLVIWVWAGVHGSFFLGLVVLGLEWLRAPSRRLLSIGGASVVAANLTAHGLAIWLILAEFVRGNEALDRISEWQPPDLLSLPLWPILAALVLFVGWARTGGLGMRRSLVVLAWFLFGLTANRSVPNMWIAWLPSLGLAARAIDERAPTTARLRAVPWWAAAILVVFGPALLVPAQPGFDTERFPVDAATHVSEERVFHDDGVGGYLILTAWPDRLVYVDDRAELYHDHYVRYSDAAAARPGWDDELERWGIRQALLSVDRPLVQVLEAAGWSTRYRDTEFVVLDAP